MAPRLRGDNSHKVLFCASLLSIAMCLNTCLNTHAMTLVKETLAACAFGSPWLTAIELGAGLSFSGVNTKNRRLDGPQLAIRRS